MLTLVAFCVMMWSMNEVAGLLACNHERGSCNFQPSSRHRLFAHQNMKTWEDANATCVKYGGALISISNASENEMASRQLTNSFKGSCPDAWIGASDKDEEGVWLWKGQNSPDPVTFNGSVDLRDAPWMPQQDLTNNRTSVHVTHWEPNGLSASDEPAEERDCGVVGKAGNWSARSCEEMHCFFCSWSEGQADVHWSWASALGGPGVETSSWRMLLIALSCLVYLMWMAEIYILHWQIGVRIKYSKDVKELESIGGTHILIQFGNWWKMAVNIAQANKGTDVKDITAVRISIPFPAGRKRLETGQRALIPYLLDGGHKTAFKSQMVQAIVEWKWTKYGRDINLIEFMLYSFFVAELTILVIWSGDTGQFVAQKDNPEFSRSFFLYLFVVAILSLRMLLQMLHIAYFRPSKQAYLTEFWNLVSIVMNVAAYSAPV